MTQIDKSLVFTCLSGIRDNGSSQIVVCDSQYLPVVEDFYEHQTAEGSRDSFVE